MSATPTQRSGAFTPTCATCGAPRDPEDDVAGSYCSRDCHLEGRGEKILGKIRSDHRICASCFQRVKTVDTPTEETKSRLGPEAEKAVMGRQYPTENTVWATDAKDSGNPHRPIEYQRWGCTCGNVDPSNHNGVIGRAHPQETIQSLFACLQHLYDIDSLSRKPQKDAYLDAIRERGFDWVMVIGQTVHES